MKIDFLMQLEYLLDCPIENRENWEIISSDIKGTPGKNAWKRLTPEGQALGMYLYAQPNASYILKVLKGQVSGKEKATIFHAIYTDAEKLYFIFTNQDSVNIYYYDKDVVEFIKDNIAFDADLVDNLKKNGIVPDQKFEIPMGEVKEKGLFNSVKEHLSSGKTM